MSDVSQGPGWWMASDGKWYPPETAPAAPPPGGEQPAVYSPGASYGPIGKRENIGLQVLWSFLTLGLYGIYWAYKCHEEIKVHTGDGVGGPVGAVIYFFVGIVTLFLLPIEIQKMYERDGRQSPVRAATAFWILLFAIPWYVKCQAALNDYWEAKGAPAP
jgi:Domain of unknown function (DUF4234)